MKYDWREEEDRLPDVVCDDDCATGLLRAWYEEEEEEGRVMYGTWGEGDLIRDGAR